jgi:hypothetical protein
MKLKCSSILIQSLAVVIFAQVLVSCSSVKNCSHHQPSISDYNILIEQEQLKHKLTMQAISDSIASSPKINSSEIKLLIDKIDTHYSKDSDGDRLYDVLDDCPNEKGKWYNRGCL